MDCPNYIRPRYYSIANKDYEGIAMCDLVDKSCLVEYGAPEDCEEYQLFLKEEVDELS